MKVQIEHRMQEKQVTRYLVQQRHIGEDGEWSDWYDLQSYSSKIVADNVVRALETELADRMQAAIDELCRANRAPRKAAV